MEIGTEAFFAACAAAWMRRPLEYVIAQGKNWMISGERLFSAARTKDIMCSML